MIEIARARAILSIGLMLSRWVRIDLGKRNFFWATLLRSQLISRQVDMKSLVEKLFHIVIIASCAGLEGCGTTKNPDQTAMSPSQISGINSSFFKRELWRGRNAVSVIVPVEDRKCGPSISLLEPSDQESERPLKNIFLESTCEASSDGQISISQKGNILFRGLPPDRSMADYAIDRRFKGTKEILKVAGDLMDFDQLYEPNALDEQISQCEDRCPTALLVGTYFAKANYYDSVERPMTGAMWRLEGLAYAMHSGAFLQEHKQALAAHLQTAYRFADDISDFEMARWVLREWEMHLRASLRYSETGEKSHLDSWEEGSKQRRAPIGYTFDLVTDTPISDYHAAGFRGLASREFKIDVMAGKIEYSFLQCSDWLLYSSVDNSIKQVELRVDLNRGWQVPAHWENCSLIILGDQGAKVRIWEYPDGSLDANGNLSA